MKQFRPPNTRVFNHRRYERGGAMDKQNAEAFAKRVRKFGRLARIVRFVNPMKRVYYYVYTANKS